MNIQTTTSLLTCAVLLAASNRSQAQATFTKITTGPVVTSGGGSLGCAWGDYDGDGFLDLFVANGLGSGQPNFLYHNNRNGTFSRIRTGAIANDAGHWRGCAWADFDNDGHLDLIAGRTSENVAQVILYRNNGDGTFTRMPDNTVGGVVASGAGNSFAPVWADYDNDGFLDLFVARLGIDWLFHNERNGTFAKITNVLVEQGAAQLNNSATNRSAIGAKVRVKATIRGRTFWQLREINGGNSFGPNQLEAHFGLGDATRIETLRIEWPSGTVQELQNVTAKQFLTITEPSRLVATLANGAPSFALQGGRGLQYDVQASTDLKSWSLLSTITITNLDGTALVTGANASNADRRFYRAVLR